MLSLVADFVQADVGDVLPMSEATEAHRRIEAGQAVGTMLLRTN